MEKKNKRCKQKKTSDKGSGDQWAQDVILVSRKPKKRLKSKEEKNKGSVFIAPSAKQRNREEWWHKAYLVSASGRAKPRASLGRKVSRALEGGL